ncbi:hypothetical protein Tco_0180312 [Tanacetum coccineum]
MVYQLTMFHVQRVDMVINPPWNLPFLGAKGLTSPEQTATGKGISNPLMAVMVCPKPYGIQLTNVSSTERVNTPGSDENRLKFFDLMYILVNVAVAAKTGSVPEVGFRMGMRCRLRWFRRGQWESEGVWFKVVGRMGRALRDAGWDASAEATAGNKERRFCGRWGGNGDAEEGWGGESGGGGGGFAGLGREAEWEELVYEDFSEVDVLSSTNNEDKVFNPGILIHENHFEVTNCVTPEKNVKKTTNASLILEDFNPPLYELPFHKEVPGSETLLSFSSENEEKVFNPGILTSKGVHTSLLPELSHRDSKAFKVIKIFESPMEIFPCSYGEDIRVLDVPCLHFYPP